MTDDNSAQSGAILSDERIRDTLRRQIDRAYSVDRSFTRATLAAETGVNVYTLDAIMSRDPAKKRRVTMEDAFSIASVLGDRAVNSLLALIGYAGRRLDDRDCRGRRTDRSHRATWVPGSGRHDHRDGVADVVGGPSGRLRSTNNTRKTPQRR